MRRRAGRRARRATRRARRGRRTTTRRGARRGARTARRGARRRARTARRAVAREAALRRLRSCGGAHAVRRCCSRMSTQAVPTCRVDEYPRRRWKVWPGERPPLPLAVCGRSHRLDGPPLGSHRPYGEVDYVLGQKDSISTNYHSGHSLSEWRDRNSSKMVEVSGLLVHGSRVEAQWRCHGNSWTEEWFPGTNTNLHHRGTPPEPNPPTTRTRTHTRQPNPAQPTPPTQTPSPTP